MIADKEGSESRHAGGEDGGAIFDCTPDEDWWCVDCYGIC